LIGFAVQEVGASAPTLRLTIMRLQPLKLQGLKASSMRAVSSDMKVEPPESIILNNSTSTFIL
jgi:hypothetical protein